MAASEAQQREGESIVWCRWNDQTSDSGRVEARLPFQDTPQFRQLFQGPDLPEYLVPLPGQRAVVTRGEKLWLLDVSARAVQLAIEQPAQLRGATADGDMLVRVENRQNVLLLRSRKVLPLSSAMTRLSAAAGSLWMEESSARRLFRIDPETAALTESPKPPGCGDFLGADVRGHLWFESEPSIVKRGELLPLCRWNPRASTSVLIQLPTQP